MNTAVKPPNTEKSVRLPRLGKTITLRGDATPGELSIAFTLAAEGVWSNDPDDPGGATNYGWTLTTFKGLDHQLADFDGDGDVDIQDLRLLTYDKAEHLYEVEFWSKLQCDRFSPRVACVLIDSAVNMGKPRAVRFLQQAFNALPLHAREGASVLGLDADGVMGPKTVSAVAAMSACGKELAENLLNARRVYYDTLRDVKKTRQVSLGDGQPQAIAYYPFRKFHGGWINRLEDLAFYLGKAFV